MVFIVLKMMNSIPLLLFTTLVVIASGQLTSADNNNSGINNVGIPGLKSTARANNAPGLNQHPANFHIPGFKNSVTDAGVLDIRNRTIQAIARSLRNPAFGAFMSDIKHPATDGLVPNLNSFSGNTVVPGQKNPVVNNVQVVPNLQNTGFITGSIPGFENPAIHGGVSGINNPAQDAIISGLKKLAEDTAELNLRNPSINTVGPSLQSPTTNTVDAALLNGLKQMPPTANAGIPDLQNSATDTVIPGINNPGANTNVSGTKQHIVPGPKNPNPIPALKETSSPQANVGIADLKNPTTDTIIPSENVSESETKQAAIDAFKNFTIESFVPGFKNPALDNSVFGGPGGLNNQTANVGIPGLNNSALDILNNSAMNFDVPGLRNPSVDVNGFGSNNQAIEGVASLRNFTTEIFKLFSEQFGNFKTQFNLNYGAEEEKLRLEIFSRNHQLLDSFNNASNSFILKINQYADLAIDEYNKLVNGLFLDRSRSHAVKFEPDSAKIPESVDWRKEGIITPARSQGRCASCYAFAAAAALESYILKKTGKREILSPQNIMDCTRTKPYTNAGCSGGSVDPCFDFIKDKGINVEMSYPYKGKAAKQCKLQDNDSTLRIGHVNGYVLLDEGDERGLEMAVATKGPVTAGMDAHAKSFQLYGGGIYYEPKCKSTVDAINHAVLVIGYTPEYWIIKNSYGADWGEEGFGKITRNVTNHCGIATYAVYPIV